MKIFGLLVEELNLGGLYAFLITVYWLHFWAVALGCVSAYLWALSGSNGQLKIWRRLGCPLIVSVALAIVMKSLVPLVSVPMAYGILSCGYGIPTKK